MSYYKYKNEQLTNYRNYLTEEDKVLKVIKQEAENTHNKLTEETNKSKLNFPIAVRVKKGQDEISEIDGPQEYIDECLLIESSRVDKLNRDIDEIYTTLESNSTKEKNHNIKLQFLDLENTKTMLTRHEIKLKLRYLRLTRVTKKIQEIVTGRDDSNRDDLVPIYEQKKKKLEENKNKRIERMNDKLNEINNEIDKKKKENLDFLEKYEKLSLEVKSKEQIINLDMDENAGNSTNQNTKTK